jgi:hypothetical protein
MNRLAAVDPWDPTGRPSDDYDVFLATVGYERRASYASRHLRPKATKRIACAFTERQCLSFDRNRQWFMEQGFKYEAVDEGKIEDWSRRLIAVTGASADREIRLAVDISSMSRLRLASLLAAILRADPRFPISVDFVYSVAKWSSPSEAPEPIESAGAVLPFFAGWSNRPELPTIAVVGLGYEPDKAVGAYEYLEASGVWAFIPTSKDPRYDRDVGRANKSLLKRVIPSQQIPYRVDQPVACFGALESVIYGSLENGRPVMLPLGPKIFALCAMLVACVHRDVPVWRISSGQYGEPAERLPSGNLIGLRARFLPDDQGRTEDEAG